MAIYGYKPPGAAADVGFTGTNTSNQRCSVANGMPSHGWAYRMGARVGRFAAATPTTALALWATDAAKNPTARLGKTATFLPSTQMTSGPEGAEHVVNLEAAVKLESGKRYGPGFLATGAQLGHGMIQAALITGDNEQFYFRDVGAQPPTDPMGYTSQSVEGWLAVWAEYQPNSPPALPTNLLPSNGGFIGTLSPTFEGDFSDPDETLPNGLAGDKLQRYHLQLRQQGQTQLKWDTAYIASPAEQAARRFSRAYAGTTLAAGVTYEWRVAVNDLFGAASPWTDSPGWQTFTVNSGGVVTNTGPSGKQEPNTGLTFSGSYTHPQAFAATHARIWLYTNAGQLIDDSGEIAKAVASGAGFTITWVESGFPDLTRGVEYNTRIALKDSAGLWTPQFSDTNYVSFFANASPTVPADLSPANSFASSSRPPLVCKSSDADDTPATGFTVDARIKDSGGGILFTRAMTLRVGTTDVWEYQTTATDLATFATYKWDAQSHDGTLNSAFSAEATFVYAAGPVVSITSPTAEQVITTATPTIAWTTTDQQKKRIEIYKTVGNVSGQADLTQKVYDSGWLVSTISNHPIPAGILRKATFYQLVVTVENSAPLQGSSPGWGFSLQYPPVDLILGFIASPSFALWDRAPSTVLLTWQETSYVVGVFNGYDLYRDGQFVLTFSSPSETAWLDAEPVSGVAHAYAIRQRILQGSDELESAESSATVTITLDAVVISDAEQGTAYRVVLPYRDGDRDFEGVDDGQVLEGWDDLPTVFFGSLNYQRFSASFKLINDERGTARAHLLAAKELYDRKQTVCLRTPDGEILYGSLTTFRSRHVTAGRYGLELGLVETARLDAT